ncbi:hypothetical protein DPMN_180107 [Dreissena polymorpha]|uniref:Uncharacterized protein n=1 Tax=Dreissena polymorpha TaxID=45954 RepID=A0A9D4IP38_DREPO|nr:hypothetical protein DPMN_180107 [Dreissena polymorpha]
MFQVMDGLSFKVENASADMLQTLHGLNIKSLNLCIKRKLKHTESLYQALSSLTQLEMLSIEVKYSSPGLWEARHCLSSNSLSMRILDVNHTESLPQSLLSLTKMETLSISLEHDCPGLWVALYGLSIKSLSLSGGVWGGLKVNYTESLSQSLLSLNQMEAIIISMTYDSPGMWVALHGLNIKILRLCLRGVRRGLRVEHEESMSQALSSLTQPETLTLYVDTYIALQVPRSLKYLNIYSNIMPDTNYGTSRADWLHVRIKLRLS